MKHDLSTKRSLTYIGIAVAVLATVFALVYACAPSNASASGNRNDIVGAWYFDAPAPFAPHLAAFHDDNTLEVMFPDAAEAARSASMGVGAWSKVNRNTYKGKFYEINATRATNQFESNLIVVFTITVDRNSFTGTATATYHSADGTLLEGPYTGPLTGWRIEV